MTNSLCTPVIQNSSPRMRRFLSIFWVLSLIAFTQALQPASPQPVVPGTPSYDLPIIDAHGHLQRKMSAEDLIRLMDLVGVSRIVLQPTVGWLGGSDEQALDYARRFPGRFIPFIGFQDGPLATPAELWLNPNQKELNYLGEVGGKLKNGKFFGWGEIILRYYGHDRPGGGKEPEINRPADSPLMFRIAELATRYRTPMIIHAEGEPLVVAAMGRLLSSYPDAQVIWAHNCGRQFVSEIRRLLKAHTNLFCDLGGMGNVSSYGTGWPRTMPWTALVDDPSGELNPEMRQLFEDFSDRFMVGMDCYFLESYQSYVARALRFRKWFSQLSPATASKLAHENAERILNLPPLAK